jgi:hypothetical protein
MLMPQLTESLTPIVTSCKSVSLMLVSPLVPKVVATVNSVITGAFSGILFDFFYRNRGSNCITEPYRKYYSRLINRLGI